ncbi:hypothetical protein [Nocardioides aquiterrae]|uniref:Uncharacterized protein n=1 Tax=Nocardioides aquiterrae TaxID=203799 RepID=A0ABP4F0H1_9ACTN
MHKSDIEYVRVVNPETGVKITVGAKVVPEGHEVVDEPAVDRNGRPLDATYPEKTTVDGVEPVARPYGEWLVKELQAEVEARNDAAGDDEPQIVVEPPGNKPELVAALEADDARRAS